MSLENDGVWKAGTWATTIWADGVWREGAVVLVEGWRAIIALAEQPINMDLNDPVLIDINDDQDIETGIN